MDPDSMRWVVPQSKRKQVDEYYLEELIRDAENIVRNLMRERSSRMLLVSIDLERSTEAIMAEVRERVIGEKREISESRLKWLSKVDEFLKVWDLYIEAGQRPTKDTFRQISRKVKRPLSTVRDQWHEAYRRIYGESYNPESKYSTEEKRAEADLLCVKCPHGAKCYRRADWFPCSDYMKISGKERRPKTIEYMETFDYSDT